MIPLQPWLMPLLVMAAVVVTFAAALGVSKIVGVGLALAGYLRGALLALVALILFVGAVVILIYGDEVADRVIALVTFIPAAVSAYLSVQSLLSPDEGGGNDGNHD